MKLVITFAAEEDGRWLGVVDALPGVMAYGASRDEAAAQAQALALWRLADLLSARELAPVDSIEFEQATRGPTTPP